MKTKLIYSVILVIVFTTFHSVKTFSQPANRPCLGICSNIYGLTDQQKEQINKEIISHQKQMLPLKNQLREKKARYHTLMTVDKPDMKAINQVIDEMGALKIQINKLKAQHVQNIRALLNDEQKLQFDMHKACKPKQIKEIRNHKRMMRNKGFNPEFENMHEQQIMDEIERN